MGVGRVDALIPTSLGNWPGVPFSADQGSCRDHSNPQGNLSFRTFVSSRLPSFPFTFLSSPSSPGDLSLWPNTIFGRARARLQLSSSALLLREHADGDGQGIALLQSGAGLFKNFKRWSYDRYEDGELHLKPDPNGGILKVSDYGSRGDVTGAWWGPGVFSDRVRTENVTLFEGPDNMGSYKENGPHVRTGVHYERSIAEGRYTKDDLWSYYGIAVDTVSSIRVPRGWKVTLYGGERFDGLSAAYTSDAPNLGPLDNAASSLTIERTGNQSKQKIAMRRSEKTMPNKTNEGYCQVAAPNPHLRRWAQRRTRNSGAVHVPVHENGNGTRLREFGCLPDSSSLEFATCGYTVCWPLTARGNQARERESLYGNGNGNEKGQRYEY